MTDSIVRVEGLSKEYTIGVRDRKRETFREMLIRRMLDPLRWVKHRGRRKAAEKKFWALKDVSFEVKRGEILGIIGRNGAGKSTLLKILSRITDPTKGRAELRGRVASLLEVGTGFHSELTGRENIYLNGTILGMKRREIHRKFDEIVAFAEIEKFIDTPVKHYSSGMYIRLAFAVAAHLNPEILIVDEVLAVGDVEFQKKCLGKMGDVAKEGRTVLFVSHNMAALAAISQKGLFLKEGKIAFQGPVKQAVDHYLTNTKSNIAEAIFDSSTDPNAEVQFKYAAILDEKGKPVQVHPLSVPTRIVIEYEVSKTIKRLQIICHVWTLRRVHVLSTADIDCAPQLMDSRSTGFYRAEICLPAHLLAPGSYQVELVCGIPNQGIIDQKEGPVFEISAVDSYAVHWSGSRQDVVVGLPLRWDTHYEGKIRGEILKGVKNLKEEKTL